MKKNMFIGVGLILISFSAFSTETAPTSVIPQTGTLLLSANPPVPPAAPIPNPVESCRIQTC